MKKLLIFIGIVLFTTSVLSQVKKIEKIVDGPININRVEKDLGEDLISDKEIDIRLNVNAPKENDIQDKKTLVGEDNTKSASDFYYLDGFNLTNATFLYNIDQINYESRFNDNEYVPQGLTKDKDGYLLISMYHKIGYWNWLYYGESLYPSIVVKYDPDNNKILKVFTLIDLEIGSHVGGIGYHYVEKPNGSYSEYIFLQGDGTNEVRIYKYVYMNPSESDYLDYEKSYTTSHTASVISNSHNYLWVVKYVGEETTNKTKSMTGFKIITNEDYSDVFLVKKYEIEQPKGCIQGVYCDSDPEIEDRLKFYFAASCNISYVYQAILTTRDFNNNNIIYGTNEYYWESYYTPYGYNSGIGKKLPDGGEGITMKDDKLWMLNEGATDYYCGDPTWDEDDIDCAREILIIDPVNFSGTHYEIFPSGSIEIFGNNLEDYGHKVAIVFAQNKQGKFYYSIGEFACETGHCEMFALTPMVPNPVGRQYNYLWFPHSYKPVVYIEDIIGIYFMNLNEEGSNGNSDDFNMSNIKFTFDDNYYLQGDNDLYSFSKQISTEFGDNSGDKDVMEFYFQFKYTGWDEGVKNFTTDMDSDVFINLRNCYDSSTSNSVCRSNALDNMEDYLDDMGGLFFYYRINYNISRLYNVER